jgi:hypothetical protein
MSVCGVMPLLRRASVIVFPALIAFSTSALPAANAQAQVQAQSASEFASSSQGLLASNYVPSNSSLAGDTSSPDPGSSSASSAASSGASSAAVGQSGGSYGNHDHNWSGRIAFEAGGGFNAPIGNDHPFITYGGNFTVGAGLQPIKHIGLLAEYQFIDDKLPGSLIADAGAQGGHAHIWSLTLDPVIYLFPSHKTDVYVTGGGGFYRKVTSFTDPEEVEQCYYFCTVGTENVVVSHFSSNQGGANLGLGFTHKFGGDVSMGEPGRMKFFAEARYLWIDTPPLGTTNGLGRTELLPVSVGVRW